MTCESTLRSLQSTWDHFATHHDDLVLSSMVGTYVSISLEDLQKFWNWLIRSGIVS